MSGEEAKNDDLWWARMEYLFRELPFPVRHRWGGDAHEFVEGIDVARKATGRGYRVATCRPLAKQIR
jgi:hypothetical protein